jgi:uncharacterized linocin/CFP29 family protein
MTDSNVQLNWTDEQWNKVRQVVYEEARRARVAGNVLPLYGPLEPDARFVAKQEVQGPLNGAPITVSDDSSLQLRTIQQLVLLRGAQVADPDLNSALIAFRRAANFLARREDKYIFQGDGGADDEPAQPKSSAKKAPKGRGGSGSQDELGLMGSAGTKVRVVQAKAEDAKGPKPGDDRGGALVRAISKAIGELEEKHHLGPFACLLGPGYFLDAQTPTNSMVLPQDRILPFLGGGALLRTSVLGEEEGLVIALGGAPIDLVVATDISVSFLQVTPDPWFMFRVYEKIVLRINQPDAIALLYPE